ncbi:hypothetical protein C9427_32455 [Mesorhizobium helmanticense]|uniref:Uncharacterized protein n=1 Tax=Mesorhizobium helmanticense TaxID=1776423 RepID=A0A2T4IKY3_9HYPH|nr:hypothetical protein C9427_32455 [Mesorhizobium helmanticense]
MSSSSCALRFDRFLHARVDKGAGGPVRPGEEDRRGHRQEVEPIAGALLRNGYLSTEADEELIAQQPPVKLVDELKERAG